MMGSLPFEVPLKRITAGKLRRYHKVSVWRHLVDFKLMAQNLRDLFLVGFGILQSLLYLRRVRPDVVFSKGGFVCFPVGIAAHMLKIPLVIHDSDAHPGLTSRLLAKYAVSIGTGAPEEYYSYPAEKTHYVGIPVDSSFKPLTASQSQKCKASLGLTDTSKPLLVVTGGGLGARNINHAITTIASQLLKSMAILHVTGQSNYGETVSQAPEHVDYIIKPFLPEGMAAAFGAATVVVTRAGASTMSELAASAKPVIIVPNPHLTGGHQLKNAGVYQDSGAAIIIDEDELILNPLKLKKAIMGVVENTKQQQTMSKAIYKFAKPDAAIDTAALIAGAAYKSNKKGAKPKHEEVVG